MSAIVNDQCWSVNFRSINQNSPEHLNLTGVQKGEWMLLFKPTSPAHCSPWVLWRRYLDIWANIPHSWV